MVKIKFNFISQSHLYISAWAFNSMGQLYKAQRLKDSYGFHKNHFNETHHLSISEGTVICPLFSLGSLISELLYIFTSLTLLSLWLVLLPPQTSLLEISGLVFFCLPRCMPKIALFSRLMSLSIKVK